MRHETYLRFDLDASKVIMERAPMPYETRRRYGRRLLRLADYLSKLHPSRYNHKYLAEKIVKGQPCGSIACAFGHTVISGKFKNIHAKVTAKFDRNGVAQLDTGMFILGDSDIDFSLTNITALRKKIGLKSKYAIDKGDMNHASDEYFGPGAWDFIFDEDAYPFSGERFPKRADVLKRIRAIADKVYGFKEVK